MLVLFYEGSAKKDQKIAYSIVAGDTAFKQLVNFKSDAGKLILERLRKELGKGDAYLKKVEAAVKRAERGKKF